MPGVRRDPSSGRTKRSLGPVRSMDTRNGCQGSGGKMDISCLGQPLYVLLLKNLAFGLMMDTVLLSKWPP